MMPYMMPNLMNLMPKICDQKEKKLKILVVKTKIF